MHGSYTNSIRNALMRTTITLRSIIIIAFALVLARGGFATQSQDTTEVFPVDSLVSSGGSGERSLRDTMSPAAMTSPAMRKPPRVDLYFDMFKERMESLRRRGIGFGGGSLYGMYAIDMSPEIALIKSDPHLRRLDFIGLGGHDHDHEPFFMAGGLGYAGVGDLTRIGGIGLAGVKNFHSRPYSGDSVTNIEVRVAWGGFLFEKAIVGSRFVATLGGVFGGGSHHCTIYRWKQSVDFNIRKGSVNEAPFLHVEPIGTMGYAIFPLFHIGFAVTVPVFFSLEGYNIRTEDFITINPGFSIKIIFGNLG